MYWPAVGEIVRIRQWDDMKADPDFEEGDNGYLYPSDMVCFNTEMKQFCGKEFTVANVRGGTIDPVEDDELGRWCYTVYMVEPVVVYDEEFNPFDFLAVLGG